LDSAVSTVRSRKSGRFSLNRAEVVDENFIEFVRDWPESAADPRRKHGRGLGSAELGDHATYPLPSGHATQVSRGLIDEPIFAGHAATCRDALELFESQIIARHQDIAARAMRARNEGFYTIASAGHEGNAVVGRLTRHTDMAFLHYRSGAFMAERARKVPGIDFVRDTMLGFAASREDPIAGGRHKVWGSVELCVPPQTSTIASHLPKAVGAALMLARARRLAGKGATSGARGEALTMGVTEASRGAVEFPRAEARGSGDFARAALDSTRQGEQTRGSGMVARAEPLTLGVKDGSHGSGPLPYGRGSDGRLMPADGIVVCSFGDATVNHAVAQTAFNVAAWATHQRLPVPILFVCEDNGIGISVETPPGWIEAAFGNRYGLRYIPADGLDLLDAYEKTAQAVDTCRTHRCPVFLHMKVVRLLGHAGSDAETEYHTWEQIEAAEANDPLLFSADLLMGAGVQTPDEVLALYEGARERVREAVAYAAKAPKLSSPAQVMEPLAPYSPDAVDREAQRPPRYEERVRVFGGEDQLPEKGPPRHMAVLINLGLHDLLTKYPEAVLFGEDVAKKGGVYHVTAGLWAKFGAGRVFNTLLDETSILGLAIGAGHLGLLPIPEIQYLAYYHNAEDQIRGEACSLQYFSKGQYRNPMVVRIQGWGYQKGFGGHFHNDNSIAALRDVPSLIVATPARGDDAVKMMRTCMAMAKVDGRVVAFIEPIALYMTKDLHEPKDGGWSFPYPPPSEAIAFEEAGIYHEDAEDLTILTFANGLYMSLRAARTLREKHGIRARVVDLRWLNPLNEKLILEQSLATKRVLVVDEGRRTGGVSEAILALLHENCAPEVKAARLTAQDTYIPLGPAAELVLPGERDIVNDAVRLASGHGQHVAPSSSR
jgi:2-oxoisovalerate dehydrogenase E1 component